MPIQYLSDDTAPLFAESTGSKKIGELLWGDHLDVIQTGASRTEVRARGKKGWVNNSAIGNNSLLEIYIIDVGQGDGILIRTPDDRHVMIDGGYKRTSQPSGKNAADFVDWKFAKDYRQTQIRLDAMIVSHCDADHYGGLADLLDVAQNSELDAQDVRVENFYHAGIGWWINPANNKRWLGPTTPDKRFLTQLVGSRTKVVNALKPNANPKLQGEWAGMLKNVTQSKTLAGTPTPIKRLSQNDEYLPGFEPGASLVSMKVLAPIETDVNNAAALYNLDSRDSINTNGNSILLRLDFGRSRILLTGDLNMKSQRQLLDDYMGNRIELQCDVAKACHHGSDDVSYEFLAAVRPAATIISSGDNEGHDHPRPAIVAASATTGYLEISNDKLITPLVYSTEIARSSNLGKPSKVTIADPAGDTVIDEANLATVTVDAKVTKAGDLNPTTVKRKLDKTYIVAGLIYGLVNIRTDGNTILCATMNEKDSTWNVRKFQSRF